VLIIQVLSPELGGCVIYDALLLDYTDITVHFFHYRRGETLAITLENSKNHSGMEIRGSSNGA